MTVARNHPKTYVNLLKVMYKILQPQFFCTKYTSSWSSESTGINSTNYKNFVYNIIGRVATHKSKRPHYKVFQNET